MKLRFGRKIGKQGEEFDVAPITVFVGPNNSGKSKILVELTQELSATGVEGHLLLLESITMEPLDERGIEDFLNSARRKGDFPDGDTVYLKVLGSTLEAKRKDLFKWFLDPNNHKNRFKYFFSRFHTLFLNGERRLHLLSSSSLHDLQEYPVTSLQRIFVDNDKRSEIRRIVHSAFGKYFVIDPTLVGTLRVRLSSVSPADEREEKGIDSQSVKFHAEAMMIDRASDGVKAFSGIIAEVIAGDPRVLIIDEPEAFLHPPLASKLAFEVATAANDSGKRVFVATHSPSFLMGCIESGVRLNIVRLTHSDHGSTARVLKSDDLLMLMRHPLLRSTGLLNGLFYDCVIITESDTDRVFYQEVNARILQFSPENGIPNCLFINAQNKQTVHTLMSPLRGLGIPVACIVDVDVLKEGGKNWGNFLTAGGIPDLSHASYAAARSSICCALEGSGKDMKKDGGIFVLQGGDRSAALGLLDNLMEYGLFVVPGGELESWLKGLNIPGKKTDWLINAFSLMGSDPNADNYVKPAEGDVWEFMARLRTWLLDDQRKGIPD